MSGPSTLRITEPIQTDRLLLRPYEERDLDDLYDLQSRPEVDRFLYWDPRTRTQVEESLSKKMALTLIAIEGDNLSLAVSEKSGGPDTGDLHLHYASAVHRQAEIGYVFHPAVHGQGFATEAPRALVDPAFGRLNLHRVWAALDARNIRSAALLERLGLRREAHLIENEWVKGEWTDEVIYAVLADEWAASRLGAPLPTPSNLAAAVSSFRSRPA